jgi:hypothetical protein
MVKVEMVWFEGVAYERFPLKRCYRKVPSHMALQNSPFQKRLFETDTTGWSFSKERLFEIGAMDWSLFEDRLFLKWAFWTGLFPKIGFLKSALWIGLFLKIDF